MRIRRRPADPIRAHLLLADIVRAYHGTCTAAGPFADLAEDRLSLLVEEAAEFIDGVTHPGVAPQSPEAGAGLGKARPASARSRWWPASRSRLSTGQATTGLTPVSRTLTGVRTQGGAR